jgi:hypothetical protein
MSHLNVSSVVSFEAQAGVSVDAEA